MQIKNFIKKGIVNVVDKTICPGCEYNKFVPPGHIYSPIPSELNLSISKRVKHDIFEGLNFNESKQLDLLSTISKHADKIPDFPVHKTEKSRYFYDNAYFSYPDATILICNLLHFKTRRIIDIGGGISSALILDLNESLFKKNPIHITVIKPEEFKVDYDDDDPNIKIINEYIQDVDRKIFNDLQGNDIVFLDTTHAVKLGSDINYLAFHILPILKHDVKVHIHDIYYPFEYPEQYFHEGKYWNEIYFWKAFLMYNNSFEIELFNSFFENEHKDFIQEKFPQYFEGMKGDVTIQGMGSSLWLKKI